MIRQTRGGQLKTSVILAVDDRPDNLFVLEQLILQHLPSCSLITATSANEGLLKVVDCDIDGVLIDVQMPGMNGIEMCRHLKDDVRTAEIPVILMTAHGAAGSLKAEGLDAGADDFLTKPIDNVELIARIKVMLRIKQAEDRLHLALDRLSEYTADKVKDLDESEQRFSSLLDQAGDAILLSARDGELVKVNRCACDVLGYDQRELMALSLSDIDPSLSAHRLDGLFNDLSAGQDTTIESAHRRKDGTTFPVEIKLGLVNLQGKPHLLWLARDITERIEQEKRKAEMNARAEQAERMESLGVLAGGVAHDLNNVLGPIVALPDLVEEDFRDLGDIVPEKERAQITNTLGVISASALRAAAVVKDLVSLTKRGSYLLAPLDINVLACDAKKAGWMDSIIKRHPDVWFNCLPADGPCMILGEDSHLSRALYNLVSNAAEAITGEGTVTVSVAQVTLDRPIVGRSVIPAGDFARIEVADTGKGIEPGDLGHVFEPFFTRKKKGERSGSGLGLSVVYGVVNDHNGFIDVTSEPGEGTSFALHFPLHRADSGSDVEPVTVSVPHGSGRVLVVDDEESQRFLACRCLKKLGYEADVASDGLAAVEIFSKNQKSGLGSPYELVVLDMIMEAGYDGLRTLREILELYPEQKVIIASGHSEDSRAKKAAELGADWLAKPYAHSDLAHAVQRKLLE